MKMFLLLKKITTEILMCYITRWQGGYDKINILDCSIPSSSV